MNPPLELFSVVALVQDLPKDGLVRGQVGTVVELLSPSLAIIEFADEQGRTYALPTLQSDQLMPLHYQRIAQAA
jgi:hypothetical protein